MVSKLYFLVICNAFSSVIIVLCRSILAFKYDLIDWLFIFLKKSGHIRDLG